MTFLYILFKLNSHSYDPLKLQYDKEAFMSSYDINNFSFIISFSYNTLISYTLLLLVFSDIFSCL